MHLCTLLLENIPSSGVAMIDINLSPYLNHLDYFNTEQYIFYAVDCVGDNVHTCFIPDEGESSPTKLFGKLVFFNLKSNKESLNIFMKPRPSYAAPTNYHLPFGIGSIEFSDSLLLKQITLNNGEAVILNFTDQIKRNLINKTWTYSEENVGEYPLILTERKIIISDEKLTVIRSYGKYVEINNSSNSSVNAYYDIYLFTELSLMYVCANVNTNYQDMHALHFMELEIPRDKYTAWSGGYPLQKGELDTSAEETISLNSWVALSSKTHILAYLSSGLCALTAEEETLRLNAHFDLTKNGAYLLNFPAETLDGWLYISERCKSSEDLESIFHTLPDKAWAHCIRPAAVVPEKLHTIASGDLIAKIRIHADGVSLFSLEDLKSAKTISHCGASSLFCITLQDLASGETYRLFSDSGWSFTSVFTDKNTHIFNLAGAGMFKCISVTLAAGISRQDAIDWNISITSSTSKWSLLQLSLAELPLAESWDKEAIVYPKGSGSLLENAWACKPNLRSTYPSLFYCMQFQAAYGKYSKENNPAFRGIYFGIHDPQGLRKDIYADYRFKNKAIHLGFIQQVPGAGEPLCRYESSTEVHWQFFDGDWYDAAQIYKRWALASSNWAQRRPLAQNANGWVENTAVWLYANVLPENPVWEKSSPQTVDCERPSWKEGIKKLSSLLGLPVAVHTYKWHQIPFDNDYPHYFPAREGFADDVKELQSHGIKIMPYINARLWDTRDRENTDYRFTSAALAGVTKNSKGEPWRECYASREKDGSLVVLGVMCPSSELWKRTVKAIIQRLYDEIGVDAVYMDQVAAAPPVPCFDQTHRHPPGIGGWWAEEYYRLVKELRSTLPAHAVLTTECNSDPFLNQFDGYLTWHWEYPDTIPLFPAVYSGKVRTFGRNYKKLDDGVATCMLAAQQLVYGDQIGWFEASIADKPYFPAIADMIRLRWLVREYINNGELCRPLTLESVPEVLTNFGWSPKKVCLPAVQTGVFKVSDQSSILVLFANGSETDVSVALRFSAEAYGLTSAELRAEYIYPSGVTEKLIVKNRFEKELGIRQQSCFALKLTSL